MYEGLKNLQIPGDPKRRGLRRAVKALALALAVLLLAYGGYGVYTYFNVKGKIKQGNIVGLDELAKALPNEPINILLLGSDRRDVIEGQARGAREFTGGAGQRADTIILIHLAPKQDNRAVIVSFPRDLRVTIPGRGKSKINAAYQGGPNLMIKTVKSLTGLSINHYVEVDFSSFQAIVDAVGGVRMYIPRPLDDRRAGLHITRTGCLPLDGRTALALVRARHIYPNADFGRIQTQQRFMRALLRKVRSVGFLLRLDKVNGLANAVGPRLKHDPDVDLPLAQGIVAQLARIGQKGVDFRIVPNNCCRTIGGQSFVLLDEPKARALFRALASDEPLPSFGKTTQSLPEPGDVRVRVLNGSGVNGLASKEVQRLRKLGFRALVGGTAQPVRTQTTITFTVDSELKATLLRRYYPAAQASVAGRGQSVDLILVLGKDFTVRPTSSPTAKPSPADEEAPLLGSCDG